MDPEEEVSSGARFETFDANARFVVIYVVLWLEARRNR